MATKYLHTMVRVQDLEKSMAFYALMGLVEIRRIVNDKGRFTLVFMADPSQPESPVELTHNWDGDIKIIDDEGIDQETKLKSIVEMEKGNKNYLLLDSKSILGEFYNTIRTFKRVSKLVKTQEMELKEKATKLISLLKSEYHIE